MADTRDRAQNKKTFDVEDPWRELVSALESDASWRSLVVVGTVDSGKSTLCRFIGAHFAHQFRTAAVDCDPGQSVLGPPTTLGFAWEPLATDQPVAMRFIGSTSPAGHYMQMLTGIRRLADRAVELGAERQIFDSSGYPATQIGKEFFFQKLDLLAPDHVAALQEDDELEPLLRLFAGRAKPRIHRLPISRSVIGRNQATRRVYRQEKFKRYFKDGFEQMLALDRVGLRGVTQALEVSVNWRNRLVGLCDADGYAVVLGILKQVNRDRSRVWLHGPPFKNDRIASVELGSVRLDHRSGREIRSPRRVYRVVND
ncbi:MAG: GTPase [Candidatus Latescibacterota bacterium]|nr:MAG: GTPase [Candidatus Latescibacterota bacterium]